ncbi:hypothetical protein [Clostridium grantii]|uniref:hypothetical protein n=1 Tax=Clostridium grantii TaxID=40575 RepID=UPI001FA88441|nr:hypothetical protein [Clostridium grantii]
MNVNVHVLKNITIAAEPVWEKEMLNVSDCIGLRDVIIVASSLNILDIIAKEIYISFAAKNAVQLSRKRKVLRYVIGVIKQLYGKKVLFQGMAATTSVIEDVIKIF